MFFPIFICTILISQIVLIEQRLVGFEQGLFCHKAQLVSKSKTRTYEKGTTSLYGYGNLYAGL